MKNHTINVFTLAITIVLSLGLAAAAIAKGPPNKVEVTMATPSEANQGQELDVVISGSGFDSGSSVSYLITGTSDDSQVDVISVEYVSDTELKTRIRPKDNALVSDYDIEVQSSSGRRGKGTTLFRVKAVETACTGFESKEPEIAYLTEQKSDGDIYTQDIYLSSASGCDQYLLLEDAVQFIPESNPKNGPGTYLQKVAHLRLEIRGTTGIVVWRDAAILPIPILGIRFQLQSDGSLSSGSHTPELVYLSPDDYNAYGPDVRINNSGEVELILVEYAPDKSEWRLVYENIDDAEPRFLLTRGNCPFEDSQGLCFQPSYTSAWWNIDGSEVYLNPTGGPLLDPTHVGLARVTRESGEWQLPEPIKILMKNDAQISVIGIRSDGLLAFEWLQVVLKKGGRSSHTWSVASIDPEVCVPFECVPGDGQEMAADGTKYPKGWTRSGGMLFMETGPGAQRNIREYSDPFTGEIGSLEIEKVDNVWDTTY